MSRQTFTLRNIGTDLGSYINYSDTVFASASLSLFQNSDFYLDVRSSDYGINSVSWNAPLFDLQEDILPVDVFIRWSTTGEPQTVEEGQSVINNGGGTGSIEHSPTSDEDLSGRWVYYSLFLRFANNVPSVYFDQEQYFEKVASVQVLMVKDYKSVDALWDRIPVYFRENDSNDDLYNYLRIFGWDVDYLRTLLDYMMVQNDPQIANSESLQLIMEELGTLITTVELGATRARQYVQDVINLRLQKGTEEGIIAALQAISGCLVTIDKINKVINVHPQRTNWARDSRIIRGLDSSSSWYGAFSDNFNVRFSQDHVTFYDEPVTFTTGASVSFNPLRSIVNDGTVEAHAFIYGKYLVPVSPNDTFYFSAESPSNGLLTRVYLYETDATLAASAGVGTTNVINTPDGRTYFKLDVSYIDEPSEVYVFMEITLPPGGYALTKNFLLEKGHMGIYFDGNTKIGGWLLGDQLRSDYRWHNSPSIDSDDPPTCEYFDTYSIYSADAWRTRKTINNIYKKLLPVNWMDQYTVVFDELPEYTYDPVPPTNLPPVGVLIPLYVSEALDTSISALNTDLGWPNFL